MRNKYWRKRPLFPRGRGPGRGGRAVIILIAACLAGCGIFAEPDRPAPDSVMVNVLVDLHLQAARDDVIPPAAGFPRDSVLARHGLDRRAFKQAMNYYVRRPDLYADLYDEVIERINLQRNAAVDSARGM